MGTFFGFVSHVLLALSELASKFDTTSEFMGLVGLIALSGVVSIFLAILLGFAKEEESLVAQLVLWPLTILSLAAFSVLVPLMTCVIGGHIILLFTS